MVKIFMKFRKKLWAEMLVNFHVNLVNTDVNRDVTGMNISNDTSASGGVHSTDT